MQLTFGFLPSPHAPAQLPLWNELDPAARAELVQILARLIANAAVTPTDEENNHHDD